MKQYLALLLSLLLALASQAQQRICVTDFGAKPDSGEDCRLAFRLAVESCGGKDAIIEFPKGRYDFWQEEGDQSTTAMQLVNAQNITVEGNGSEFVFHGKMRVMLIKQSQGILLRNFSTDWHRRGRPRPLVQVESAHKPRYSKQCVRELLYVRL